MVLRNLSGKPECIAKSKMADYPETLAVLKIDMSHYGIASSKQIVRNQDGGRKRTVK